MNIALIAAVASNGVVGRNNQLPWQLGEDLRYFKRTTLGKPVIMGRRTWDSIGRPLPGRANIVVSRQADLQIEGALVVSDLAAALDQASHIAASENCDEIMIIGGAEIYRLAFTFANRLYLTEIHAEFEGDAWFPQWDRESWRECSRETHAAGDANPFDYSFVIYQREQTVT